MQLGPEYWSIERLDLVHNGVTIQAKTDWLSIDRKDSGWSLAGVVHEADTGICIKRRAPEIDRVISIDRNDAIHVFGKREDDYVFDGKETASPPVMFYGSANSVTVNGGRVTIGGSPPTPHLAMAWQNAMQN